MSDPGEVIAQARRTTVLAISRQLGSGGAFIGRTVADRLRLRYADRDILHQAAQNLGVDDAEVGPLCRGWPIGSLPESACSMLDVDAGAS